MYQVSADKIREYLEAIPVIIVVLRPDGCVDYINNKGCDLLGFAQEDVIGKNWFRHFVPAPQQEILSKMYHNVLLRGIRDDGPMENHVVDRSGKYHLIRWHNAFLHDDTGGITAFLSSGEDITAETSLHLEMQETHERFRALVQNSSDMIAILDPAGNYMYVSSAVTHVLGYYPEELTGFNIYQYIHPDDHAFIVADLEKLADHHSVQTQPFRFPDKNGHWRWIEANIANSIEDPLIKGILVNARDVTERMRLKQRLEQEEQLRQQRITSAVIRAQEVDRAQLGQELHDNVNQVLTTVKLYVELLQQQTGDHELMRKSVHYLQHCITEIRSISKRLSAPTLGNISLTDSVVELIESINVTQRIRVVYKFEGTPAVRVSQDLHLCLYRVLQEQFNNILKHAQATKASVHIAFRDRDILLRIADNGKGFDTQARSNGIGITNMKTRVENQGGVFSINSKPGAGCTVEAAVPYRGAQEN